VGYELQLLPITHLAGLVEQYGATRVYRAVFDALGFHPNLINSVSEAAAVADYLTSTEKGI
jgi:hypothetical protein